jgi:hypothetical protein
MTGARIDLRRPLLADLRLVLVPWLTVRALLVIAYVTAFAIAERVLPGARPDALGEGLVAWDGTWYRDIASHGYASLPREGLRFFPLFPLLGRAVGVVFLGNTGAALVVIANLCSIVMLVLLLRLLRRERIDATTAHRVIWFTVLFPGAFVLAWAYAEALWILAAVAVFLAIRTRRWLWAAVAGFVAGLSRPLGVFLAVPVAVELIRDWRSTDRRDRAAGLLAVVSPLMGTATYLLWVGDRFGDPWLPFTVQSDLRGQSMDPFSRLWEGLGQMLGPERLGDGLHIPFAIAFLVLLVVVLRRLPVSYGLFSACVLAAALGTENLNSLERYGLNAFPLVIALALLCRRGEAETVTKVILAGGVIALASMAWMGAYVP